MSEFAHLNLEAWPFQVVPSDESSKRWVGRPAMERKLRGLLRTVQRVSPSRIVLLWAAYGAGKTHALRHLAHLADDQRDVRALYVVTPKGVKHFLDVYRAVVDAALRNDLISELGLALYRRSGPDQPTNLRRALVRIVSLNEPQTRTPVSWLKAEKVPAAELRASGLTRRLETSPDGIDTLNELVELLRTELGVKLILLLDEIQELGELAPRQLDEAVGGLHKVFDRNTEGLTLVFSFTTAAQDTVEGIIGSTLYERRSDTLALPALSADEGVAFVGELIAQRSLDKTRAPFPFTPQAIRAVVEHVVGPDGVTPRELIRAFDAILRDAEVEIDDGVLTGLTPKEALDRVPV